MLIRTIAAVALVAFSVSAAHAGSVTNGAWSASGCGTDPGPAPEISSRSPKFYNKSMKDVQAWQDTSKTFTECLVSEGKGDQSAIVATINKRIADFNTANQTISDANNKAVAALNGGTGGKKKLGGGGLAH